MAIVKDKPLVTFVVLGWNNKPLLKECFESIQQQSYKNISVVYVDSGSADGSVQYVKKQFPKIDVIDAGENLGFAAGNNRGITRAFQNKACRYVALLNTDARVAPDWVAKLVGFAKDHPKAAGLQTPTLNYNRRKMLDSRGIKIDLMGRAIQLGYREAVGSYKTVQVFGVNAAAALYTRRFLEAQPFGQDYFDSDFFMYLEDTDLAARATIMGWQNWLVAGSAAYHMGSTSKNPGFSIFLIYRNNSLMLIKNLPFGILLLIIPGLILSDCKTLAGELIHFNFATVKAILKGRILSLRRLPRIYKKRRQLVKIRKISEAELRQLMRAK